MQKAQDLACDMENWASEYVLKVGRMHLQAANGLVADESLQYECILEEIACRAFDNQWLCKNRIVVVIPKENSEFKG